MKQESLNEVLKELKLDSLEDLYLNIGNGKYSAKSVVKKQDEEKEEEKPKKTINKIFDNDIIVGDTNNIKTHIYETEFIKRNGNWK